MGTVKQRTKIHKEAMFDEPVCGDWTFFIWPGGFLMLDLGMLEQGWLDLHTFSAMCSICERMSMG